MSVLGVLIRCLVYFVALVLFIKSGLLGGSYFTFGFKLASRVFYLFKV